MSREHSVRPPPAPPPPDLSAATPRFEGCRANPSHLPASACKDKSVCTVCGHRILSIFPVNAGAVRYLPIIPAGVGPLTTCSQFGLDLRTPYLFSLTFCSPLGCNFEKRNACSCGCFVFLKLVVLPLYFVFRLIGSPF